MKNLFILFSGILFLIGNLNAQTSFDVTNKTTGDTLLSVENTGKVGIGITNPTAGLHVNHNNGFMSSGTYGVGSIPVEGAGTRMMWYAGKAAFRVGYVANSNWNDINIGNYSIALGNNTIASGSYSTALGRNTTANGYISTALGFNTIASGYNATAMGYETTASGDYTTAMGYETTADGENSTAMGRGTIANGYNSLSIGREIEAAGEYSIAIALKDMNGLQVTQDSTLAIMGGKVGIETVNPSAELQVGGTQGVLCTGTYGSGTIPVEGEGTRMMWYPGKAAFRAGRVSWTGSTYWDESSVGSNSAAFGWNTMASGSYSTAAGRFSKAIGGSSIAFGYANEASGFATTAFGYATEASGDYSTVMGYLSNAKDDYAVAIGNRAKANHRGSLVIVANLNADSVRSGGDEQMVLRADGGLYLTNIAEEAPYDASRLINTVTGGYLSSGGTWIDASSRDYKENISNLSLEQAINAVQQLQPVTYNYKTDKEENCVGFIAEDVPDLVAVKDRKGLSPMDIVAVLTKVVQNQQSEINWLKKKINHLENKEL